MQRITLVLNELSCLDELLSKLMVAGYKGITVIDSMHSVNALVKESPEPPSIFGSLRSYIRSNKCENKMIFFLAEDSGVEEAVKIIKDVTGKLQSPSQKGYVFATPVTFLEGV